LDEEQQRMASPTFLKGRADGDRYHGRQTERDQVMGGQIHGTELPPENKEDPCMRKRVRGKGDIRRPTYHGGTNAPPW